MPQFHHYNGIFIPPLKLPSMETPDVPYVGNLSDSGTSSSDAEPTPRVGKPNSPRPQLPLSLQDTAPMPPHPTTAPTDGDGNAQTSASAAAAAGPQHPPPTDDTTRSVASSHAKTGSAGALSRGTSQQISGSLSPSATSSDGGSRQSAAQSVTEAQVGGVLLVPPEALTTASGPTVPGDQPSSSPSASRDASGLGSPQISCVSEEARPLELGREGRLPRAQAVGRSPAGRGHARQTSAVLCSPQASFTSQPSDVFSESMVSPDQQQGFAALLSTLRGSEEGVDQSTGLLTDVTPGLLTDVTPGVEPRRLFAPPARPVPRPSFLSHPNSICACDALTRECAQSWHTATVTRPQSP